MTTTQLKEPLVAEATTPSSWRDPYAPGVVGRTLRDSAYGLTALPVALLSCVAMVAGVGVGVSTLVIWVGIPVLVGTVALARVFASAQRVQLRGLGVDVHTPDYRVAPHGASRVTRLLTPLRDVQSWLDVVWGVVSLVTGTLAFSVVLTWWAAAGAGTTYWFWQRWLPDQDGQSLAELIGLGQGRGPETLLNTAFGLVALATLPAAVRAVAWLHASLAVVLLDSRAAMQQEVRRVIGTRSAAQDAEVGSLRRLERDIHDGPQQRLVRLSMDLGRARRSVDDPERTAALLDDALAQAREAVGELRSLSRGIAPPILVDRGLEAALRELAVRQPLPVGLEYDVAGPLPAPVETALYFVVAEALTNVAKHSGAGQVLVRVERRGDEVLATVADDGTGGAHPAKGHGLAGLRTRLAGLEGTLELDSPDGGPTTVHARVPLPR
ncbi:MAG: sensor histidine kinase [Nocardioides sp.]|uniref:sensor histidine kinase n=1 Tax=Nocardioides sp. TaxID=35761 RepID=UPI003F0BAA08